MALSATIVTPTVDVRRARDDLGAFAALIGWPMEPWQLDAMQCPSRQIVLISPRQCGKSRSLSILATWTAFRKSRQMILLVSAGEEAAGRLLRTIRDITTHPLLAGSIVDETQHRVVLSNGSEIRSVPASDRQVRGWSVDLLIVDEAAFVSEDLLVSAALPTTAARPDAQIVLASSPWGDAGPFYQLAQQGLDGSNAHISTFRWKLNDAWWIERSVIEAARATMSPLRFRAEYEGEFVTSGDSYFDREDILACVADYPLRRDGLDGNARMPGMLGLDWGRQQDAHAAVLVGLLDDYGLNGQSIVVAPWLETSRRPYGAQVQEVEALTKLWQLTVRTETNGVGAYPSEELSRRLGGRIRVNPSATSQKSKEDAYGRLRILLAERAIVLPQHEELLRQLGGITATATPSGGLRIAARVQSLHDDLPDALVLAITALPKELAKVPIRELPDNLETVETPEGVQVPLPVRTVRAELDWGEAYAPSAFEPSSGEPSIWDEVYGSTTKNNPIQRMINGYVTTGTDH